MKVNQALDKLYKAAYYNEDLSDQQVKQYDSFYQLASDFYTDNQGNYRDNNKGNEQFDLTEVIQHAISNQGKDAGLKEINEDAEYLPVSSINISDYFPLLKDVGFNIEYSDEIKQEFDTNIESASNAETISTRTIQYLNNSLLNKLDITDPDIVGELDISNADAPRPSLLSIEFDPPPPPPEDELDDLPPPPPPVDDEIYEIDDNDLPPPPPPEDELDDLQPPPPLEDEMNEDNTASSVAGSDLSREQQDAAFESDSELSGGYASDSDQSNILESTVNSSIGYEQEFSDTQSTISGIDEIGDLFDKKNNIDTTVAEVNVQEMLNKTPKNSGYNAWQALEEAQKNITTMQNEIDNKSTSTNNIMDAGPATKNLRTALTRYLSTVNKDNINVSAAKSLDKSLGKDQIAQNLDSIFKDLNKAGIQRIDSKNKEPMKQNLEQISDKISNIMQQDAKLKVPVEYLEIKKEKMNPRK